ncbi:SusC/RagA family TonB-linked outer membrane protein [Sphingobacterium deserti]|uniref:TonB-dependent receptor n=1 Tax=Sphingobacterium deserti TaxID=1229276 RepID=A0A0B8T7P3_9SPHI|nr:SusC/RagA family TonB-linked outer membrane protein [Sphingobacterium deserti]KGE14554.1 TonB-dependent receptor [Sphingobacterium deserti]
MKTDRKVKKVQPLTWIYISCIILLFHVHHIQAQTGTKPKTEVRGIVRDANGVALPSVTVQIKGLNRSATTTSQGEFQIDVEEPNATLVIQAIGFQKQELSIPQNRQLSITLLADVTGLEEVVVTALGISRQAKSLGYAAQEVKGDDLTEVRSSNFVDGLAGKVAGVTIVGNPSGVGASSRITIRGDKSLNLNANQPLFVIDGVPITNEVFGSSGRSFQETDYGNGAGLVNPDDVESVSVLKGANASALYGSRAANGVILITTKSGKGQRGLGISVNSSVTFENPLVLPEFQNRYGQGVNGEFSFEDGIGGGLNDGVDESWGPLLDGRLIKQFNSPTSNGFRGGEVNMVDDGAIGSAADLAARGEVIATPWIARPDNVRNFFQTGKTWINNVAFAGGNDKGDFRFAYTNFDQSGIVPNTDLTRHTFAFNSGYKLTDRLDLRASVNYVNSNSGNRPNLSYGTENIIYLLYGWLGRQVDLDAKREWWQAGRQDVQQFNSNYNYHDNPYFNLFVNTNGISDNRLFGNVVLNYKFTDYLKAFVRVGTDYTHQQQTRRRAFSTQRFPFGSYRENKLTNEERNLDFLLSFNKRFGDINLAINAGGNQRNVNGNMLDVSAPQLIIPGTYSLANTRVALISDQYNTRRRVNSIYGSAQIDYRDFLFLELTARNDWASSLTLPFGASPTSTSDNAYFYPSASLSFVLNGAMDLPDWWSYAKVRAGFAQVGNDTDPYTFAQPYLRTDPYGSFPAFSESGRLPNYNLLPEISDSYEVGTELRFFNSRLNFDFTYYNITTRNQILTNVPLSYSSGLSSMVMNAGKIRNWGYEAMLSATPVVTEGGFQWNFNVNFSTNRSVVLELAPDQGISNYVMASRYVSVEAREGERMGNMYGLGYKRVEDTNSPYHGQIIYNSEGKPLPTDNIVKLGNYNPDWLMGIRNSFAYKGVHLSALLDIRHGGQVYSHTQVIGRETGALIETLEGRANGYDLTQEGNGVIGEGVVQNADGTYSPNAVQLSSREWHTSYTLGRSLLEGAVFDASFVKLRELSIGYTLPSRMIAKLPIKDVKFSLIGRNLALWSNVPHIDPETASMSGGTIIPGVESMALPSTRSWGFSLNFKL